MCSARSVLVIAVVLGVAAACERPSERVAQERQMVGRALRGALAFPGSVVMGYAAGDEAAELVLATSASLDVVTGWYREALRTNGWVLRRDSRDREGTITLYAERERRPLWVRLSARGESGTTYALVGVEVRGDTIK